MKAIVKKLPVRQTGATLITALIMMIVLTLLVISAMNSATVNLRIAGNMQIQQEAVSAAQQATEQVLSNNFTANPAASNIPVIIGGTSYPVSMVQPTCTGSTPIRNNYPNLPTQCLSSSTSQNTGIFFISGVAQAATSWCLSQTWDVSATVTDPRTGASATTHQGVSIQVPIGTTC